MVSMKDAACPAPLVTSPLYAVPHPFAAIPASSCRPNRCVRGFFLIETLGAVVLIAVLVGLVLPGMQQLLRLHQVRMVAKDLSAEIFWAQAEAARRSSALVLRLKSVSDCKAVPTGTPRRCGWDVFIDNNQDGLQQADEPTVHTYDNPGDLTITPRNDDTLFIGPAGTLSNKNGSSGSVGTSFLVESANARPGDSASRRVCINGATRVRVAATAVCTS